MPIDIGIVPGNGGGSIEDGNWYGWLGHKLSQIEGVTCTLRDMPDPHSAREKFWIPFMKDVMKCGPRTIIVGHSSGAAAALRYAEEHPILGFVLVGAYTTDLGMTSERKAGYFNRPWQWEKIKSNTQFMVQFGSTDDPFLPWSEQKEVADSLQLDLKQYSDKGHFCTESCPEILKTLKQYIEKLQADGIV